jgi:hypothetical protein
MQPGRGAVARSDQLGRRPARRHAQIAAVAGPAAHLLEQDLEGKLGVERDPVLPALPEEAALGLLLLGLLAVALAVAPAAPTAAVVVARARGPAIATAGSVQLELLVAAGAASAPGTGISNGPGQLKPAAWALAGSYRNGRRRSEGRAGAARMGRSEWATGLDTEVGPTPAPPAPSWARTSCWAILRCSLLSSSRCRGQRLAQSRPEGACCRATVSTAACSCPGPDSSLGETKGFRLAHHGVYNTVMRAPFRQQRPANVATCAAPASHEWPGGPTKGPLPALLP